MSNARRIVVLLSAVGALALVTSGCIREKQSEPAPASAADHPKGEHPKADHPKGEHPKGGTTN